MGRISLKPPGVGGKKSQREIIAIECYIKKFLIAHKPNVFLVFFTGRGEYQ